MAETNEECAQETTQDIRYREPWREVTWELAKEKMYRMRELMMHELTPEAVAEFMQIGREFARDIKSIIEGSWSPTYFDCKSEKCTRGDRNTGIIIRYEHFLEAGAVCPLCHTFGSSDVVSEYVVDDLCNKAEEQKNVLPRLTPEEWETKKCVVCGEPAEKRITANGKEFAYYCNEHTPPASEMVDELLEAQKVET